MEHSPSPDTARAGGDLRRTILFHRRYGGFTGGHLKVWDYYTHVRHSAVYRPQIYFSRVRWDAGNPWLEERGNALSEWSPAGADALFLAGMDWALLTEDQRRSPRVPVINLIQHVRHADPGDRRYEFLKYRAVRICVSEEVADALRASGDVNGPVFTIPNGIDGGDLPRPAAAGKKTDILIAGLKQPGLARQLKKRLRMRFLLGRRIEALTERMPRAAFLEKVARARITIFLPHRREGFYLPALEGMALGTIVICPDCVGNRSFCRDGSNCFRPEHDAGSILRAVLSAMRLSPGAEDRMLFLARETVSRHTLQAERAAFLTLLDDLTRTWAQAG